MSGSCVSCLQRRHIAERSRTRPHWSTCSLESHQNGDAERRRKQDVFHELPHTYKGEDLVFTFLIWLQNHEKEMQEEMANKRLLIMIPEDWKKHRNVLNCHICNKSLVKDLYCDWWYTILIQENTADKVTEDATTMRQKINMCRTIGENQKMK